MPAIYYGGYDISYILLLIPVLIFSLWAQTSVTSTFNRYNKVTNKRRMTGYDAARLILDRNGLYHVQIEHISGNLTDHYDPKADVIRLSDSVYNTPPLPPSVLPRTKRDTRYSTQRDTVRSSCAHPSFR